jgi:aromatic ring-opening dioxygenase catalytic subunit (LigB family)
MIAPLLIWPEKLPTRTPLDSIGGPKGPNAQFLRDFGNTLVDKYNPRGIVVFSAHWESHGHIEGTPPLPYFPRFPFPVPWTRFLGWLLSLVTSYEKNHLLYDYYNFPEEMYKVKFESNGSTAIATRVVELLTKVSHSIK